MKLLQNICFIFLLATFSNAYAENCGFESNYKACIKAAKKGDATAQFYLGSMYADGRNGAIQNYKKAFNWYKLAAQKGVPEAQRGLGDAYAKGQGVQQDYIQAHMWINIAKTQMNQQNVSNTVRSIGDSIMLSKLSNIEANMSSYQIELAQDLALEWMESHY